MVAQAANYCKKGDQSHTEWKKHGKEGPHFGLNAIVFEYGEMPADKAQGKRSDLDRVKELIDDGATIKDIATTEFPAFVKFFRGIQKYQALTTAEREHKTRLIIITGTPGTFKSFGLSRMRRRYHVVKPTGNGGCWYDGYDPVGHDCVILDDFNGSWMPYTNLLEITDRYACQVQTKGGTVQFTARAIGITSNTPADAWYANMDYAALERRTELHYTHVRCDAPSDAKGLAVNDILVTCIKGPIECHPLFDLLQKVSATEYKLDTDFQAEIAEMQGSPEDVQDAWNTIYEEYDVPNEVDEPELSDDMSKMSISSDDDELDSDESSDSLAKPDFSYLDSTVIDD